MALQLQQRREKTDNNDVYISTRLNTGTSLKKWRFLVILFIYIHNIPQADTCDNLPQNIKLFHFLQSMVNNVFLCYTIIMDEQFLARL